MTVERNYKDVTGPATSTKDGSPTMNFAPKYLAVAREIKERETQLLRSPYMIELEPEATCQLSCFGCSYGEIRSIQVIDPNRRRIPLDKLKSVIDEVRGQDTHGIFISGGGEPMNYPHIKELIVYAGENISPVFIQTNGIGLRKIKDDAMVMANIREISVSIYGSDQESFERTTGRGVNTFNSFIETMNEFMEAKNRGLFPSTLIINGKILITPGNYKKIAEMIRMCEQWGMDSILLREIQNIETGFPSTKVKTLSEDERQELMEILKPLSGRTYVDRLIKFEQAPPIKASSSCFTASLGMLAVIDTDGDVYIGTPEVGEKRLVIGNINKTRFGEIWGGEKHQEIIKEVDNMQRDRRCLIDNCRHAPSHVAAEKYIKGEIEAPTISEVLSDPLGQFI